MRQHDISVVKVSAHATEADVDRGLPRFMYEGNHYAEAAANLGRELHPSNAGLESECFPAYDFVQMVAKFGARKNAASLAAADDAPALDRHSQERPTPWS